MFLVRGDEVLGKLWVDVALAKALEVNKQGDRLRAICRPAKPVSVNNGHDKHRATNTGKDSKRGAGSG